MKKKIIENRITAIKRHFVRGSIIGFISSGIVLSMLLPIFKITGEDVIFTFITSLLFAFWNGVLSAGYKAYTLSI